MPDEYISRAEALRAALFLHGANRSPAQNAMLDRICCDIKNRPAADVAEVVRCEACAKHYVINGRDMCARNAQGSGTHWIGLTATSPDAFCSRGERKGVNDDA